MVFPNDYNAFQNYTPDDFRTCATNIHKNAHGVFIGNGGDVVLVGTDKVQATFKNVPSGTLLPINAIQIKLTGTTATNIIVLYKIPKPAV